MKKNRPLLVDLCCGAGGCSKGYAKLGFEVVGVDINPQPHYPFKFVQADVMSLDLEKEFPDAACFHASPPCQPFSIATKRYRNQGRVYPDILAPLREKLLKTGKPFIIENVPGAPLRKDLMLCGEMFGLRVIRHRIFEIHGFTVNQPQHKKHQKPITPGKSYYASIAGNGGNSYSYRFQDWQKAMHIDWMNKHELTQAIPPAYTLYIGLHMFRFRFRSVAIV